MTSNKAKRILIVDDMPGWRELLSLTLKRIGYDITSVDSFKNAQKMLDDYRFDLAVLDKRLVDTDPYNIEGMILLKEIRENYPAMKVILLTGYPDKALKERALDYYSVNHYLEKVPPQKTFDIEEFREIVNDLLRD
ncbi:MAG: response regulator [Calditrichia bacterium]